MALAALISATREAQEPGVALRATFWLAGRTLVERQARLAADAGACIYTPLQQKKYATNHLEVGCWYLDCPANPTPDDESQARQSLDAASFPPTRATDFVDILKEESIQLIHVLGDNSS